MYDCVIDLLCVLFLAGDFSLNPVSTVNSDGQCLSGFSTVIIDKGNKEVYSPFSRLNVHTIFPRSEAGATNFFTLQ